MAVLTSKQVNALFCRKKPLFCRMLSIMKKVRYIFEVHSKTSTYEKSHSRYFSTVLFYC